MTLLVADSGPLIALARLNLLWLPARTHDEVFVTDVVWSELNFAPPPHEHALLMAARESGWLTIIAPPRVNAGLQIDPSLDDGEASVISLALACHARVLIDEHRGRIVAARHSLQVVGTLGLLLRARELGLIGALRPMVEILLASNYFLSRSLVQHVLTRAGE